MSQDKQLLTQVEQQAQRMKQAEKDRPTLISQTVYIGTLGLLFILPVIGGAYLGLWLDNLAVDYSSQWTLSLLLAGVFLGAINVYLFIRERG